MTTAAPQELTTEAEIVEIEVAVSDRMEDIDAAMSVVHDGFVEAGYMQPQPSGRRMHPSYLNPGTTFLIATMEGRVVGACALVCDGPFGLPSDRAFVEENDSLRDEGLPPLREGGSLAIRSDARRHTRRIMMRLTAAIARTIIADDPRGCVVIAVAPESQRFYRGALGTMTITDQRPYIGAPAVLLRTSGAEIEAHCAQRESVLQRTMNSLLDEVHPAWLVDRRTHSPLPGAWLAEFIAEQSLTRRLGEQIGLLATSYPEALAGILAEAALPVVT